MERFLRCGQTNALPYRLQNRLSVKPGRSNFTPGVPRSTLSGMMPRCLVSTCLAVVAISALLSAQSASSKSGVQQKPFGTHDGRPITLYTLTNSHGLEIRAMNYGGIILSIRVPD